MNLHEECLIKYLLHPQDLVASTELLKLNNIQIEKNIKCNKRSGKMADISCIPARI